MELLDRVTHVLAAEQQDGLSYLSDMTLYWNGFCNLALSGSYPFHVMNTDVLGVVAIKV